MSSASRSGVLARRCYPQSSKAATSLTSNSTQRAAVSPGDRLRPKTASPLIHSAQHESFDGSLNRDMATIFSASAIVG